MNRLAAGEAVRPEDVSLTPRTASRVLGLSEEYVAEMIADGRLPHVTDAKGRRRIPLAAFHAFQVKFETERRVALHELVALGQELDMGY